MWYSDFLMHPSWRGLLECGKETYINTKLEESEIFWRLCTGFLPWQLSLHPANCHISNYFCADRSDIGNCAIQGAKNKQAGLLIFVAYFYPEHYEFFCR